jgi:hypothetical protein
VSRHRSDELILQGVSSIVFDASCAHVYAPGTRRRIKSALTLGATVEEIVEVLTLRVFRGIQAGNLAPAIPAVGTARRSVNGNQPQKGRKPEQ